jgi:hypothetical protein
LVISISRLGFSGRDSSRSSIHRSAVKTCHQSGGVAREVPFEVE